MIVYHAEEMCKLVYSKFHIEKEKAEVMNKIYEVASQEHFIGKKYYDLERGRQIV